MQKFHITDIWEHYSPKATFGACFPSPAFLHMNGWVSPAVKKIRYHKVWTLLLAKLMHMMNSYITLEIVCCEFLHNSRSEVLFFGVNCCFKLCVIKIYNILNPILYEYPVCIIFTRLTGRKEHLLKKIVMLSRFLLILQQPFSKFIANVVNNFKNICTEYHIKKSELFHQYIKKGIWSISSVMSIIRMYFKRLYFNSKKKHELLIFR